MKLRRRGEELRQQFGSDFQVLHDTYFAELERVKEQMAKLESSYDVCLRKECVGFAFIKEYRDGFMI